MLNRVRDTLKRIFQPLVTDIQRLVDDQVNLVKVKRMTDGHAKAKDIKVPILLSLRSKLSSNLTRFPGHFPSRRLRLQRIPQAVSRSRASRQSSHPAPRCLVCHRQVRLHLSPTSSSLPFPPRFLQVANTFPRGAVLSQLPKEAVITSTVATQHYGVSALAAYDEAEDAGQPICKDRFTGRDRVSKARSPPMSPLPVPAPLLPISLPPASLFVLTSHR